ncbi:hypothetical protein AVW11_24060 [Streptomyces amritsarensis]|uniref:Integrase n=2 Tax=Streptomyces amritsarensis TaxID=681158 RepID=A0ABX3G0P4_9ACTN|nr:hypothetical protein AVW11_24060 [Streptomyces amritsarensis]
MPSFQPGHIRTWLGELEENVPASSHRRIIFGTVSAAFAAAVDDGLLSKNPCRARSVPVPKPAPPRVTPWTIAQVLAVRAALPRHLGPRSTVDFASGCGLRQGEVFGLSEDEIDYEGE